MIPHAVSSLSSMAHASLPCHICTSGLSLQSVPNFHRQSRQNPPFTPTARSTALFFGGNVNLEEWLTEKLFGTFDDAPLSDEEQNPHKELARYSGLLDSGADGGATQAHASLEFYLKTWARRLEDDGSVTSPFMAFIFDPGSDSEPVGPCFPGASEQNHGWEEKVLRTSGIKLKFKNRPRYLNQKEQKAMDNGVLPDRKGGKIDAGSAGGVELLIQTVQWGAPVSGAMRMEDYENEQIVLMNETVVEDSNATQTLRLTVRRCDIDEDTIIKFESERTIKRRLEEAMGVWKRMRKNLKSSNFGRAKRFVIIK